MKKLISILAIIVLFGVLVAGATVALWHNVTDISGAAPDALHLISFIALIPMIGVVGGKYTHRKIAYIKNNQIFKPFVIGIFLLTYASFVPWILTFITASNKLILYLDWGIVLTNIALSFIVFSLFLYVFIRDS